jgi:excisionase family DNA binding protein
MCRVSGRLVSTGEAARRLGVNLRTLQRWVREGRITPDWTTPGGHMRWDVERLLQEIRRLPRDEAD